MRYYPVLKNISRSRNHDKNHLLFIPDDSYYNYAGCKSKRSLSPFHYDTWKLILIGDKNVPGGRIRRTTSELVVTNEQKDEPPKDQPSQPQQQPQQPPQLATNTTNTRPAYDVKYISGYSTSEATVQFRTTEATSTPVIQVQSVKDAEGIKIPSTNFTNPKKKVTQSVKADDTVSAMMD